jgi:hypothetical protein
LEENTKEWHSVTTNYSAISTAFKEDKATAQDVLGNNAIRVLKLHD